MVRTHDNSQTPSLFDGICTLRRAIQRDIYQQLLYDSLAQAFVALGRLALLGRELDMESRVLEVRVRDRRLWGPRSVSMQSRISYFWTLVGKESKVANRVRFSGVKKNPLRTSGFVAIVCHQDKNLWRRHLGEIRHSGRGLPRHRTVVRSESRRPVRSKSDGCHLPSPTPESLNFSPGWGAGHPSPLSCHTPPPSSVKDRYDEDEDTKHEDPFPAKVRVNWSWAENRTAT